MKKSKNCGRSIIFLLSLMICLFIQVQMSWSQTNWQKIASPEGGIIHSLAIDPADSQTVYPGTSGGSVFKATFALTAWQEVTSMQNARDQFTGGVINGKIYVFGGNGDPNGINLKTTEVLNPATGLWSYVASNEHNNGQGVEELTAAVVNNKLYVFGAYGGGTGLLNFVEEYNPATNTWTSKAAMPTTRSCSTAVTYNGEIFVFGGQLPNYQHTDVVEAYNPATNTWRSVTNMPVILFAPSISVVGSKAFVIGGTYGNPWVTVNTVMSYDFLSNMWTTTGYAPMPTPRGITYAAAAPVMNGKIYLIGGATGTETSYSYSNIVEIYDTVTNTWTTGPSLPTPLGSELPLILNGEIYVVGGVTGETTEGKDIRTSAVWKYVSTALYASFTSAGIWQRCGSSWTQLTPDNPESMVAAGSNLYGKFANGIWQWTGSGWNKLTPDKPAEMVAAGSNLYGSFTGNGIWQWNGSGWTQLTPDNPESMVAAGSNLYGKFGNGVWQWTGSGWNKLTPDKPAEMVAAGSNLYGSFTGNGIWQWNGSGWTQLTPDNPEAMSAAGSNLYGKFESGIWQWNGSGWSKLTPDKPASMASAGSNLYGSFTGNGIWQWNGTGWSQLTPDNPAIMAVGE